MKLRPIRATRSTYLAGIAAGILFLVILLLGGVGWYGSEVALNPDRNNPAWSLGDYPELRAEPIRFSSPTGVTLEGRFFKGTHGGTVVMHHGFTTLQDQVIPQAAILNEAGYNVLTYDARHPSYGDGIYATMGILEREDMVAGIEYALTRSDVDPDRIGVWGISLGGATVLLAAELDPRIQAVIAEVPFSDAPNVINTSFQNYIGLPAFPFGQVTRRIAEWRASARMDDARPVDAIAAVTDRPILLIHGLADEAVPPDHSERLLAAGSDNVEVWWIPDAGHSDAFIIGGDEYAERLVEFFDRHIGRD